MKREPGNGTQYLRMGWQDHQTYVNFSEKELKRTFSLSIEVINLGFPVIPPNKP